MSTEIAKINQDITEYNDRMSRLCQQYNSGYAQKQAPATMEQIVNNRDKIPPLNQIVKHRGRAYTEALTLEIINVTLEKFVNVIRPMNREMITATAGLICDQYPLMTPADVKLMMRKGVMGEFGPILDRVDGALIMSWCRQYWEQMKYLIRMRSKPEEPVSNAVPPPQEYLEKAEKLRQKMIENQREQQVMSAREQLEAYGWDYDEVIEQAKTEEE